MTRIRGWNNPFRYIDPTGLYGYDASTGTISHADGTITDTSGNVISTPPDGSNPGYYYGGSGSLGGSGNSKGESARVGQYTTQGKDEDGNDVDSTWDKNGKIVSKTIFDEKGNLKETRYYDREGKLQCKYVYQDNGMVGSYTTYNQNGFSKVTFDKNGELYSKHQELKDQDGTRTIKTSYYKYNELKSEHEAKFSRENKLISYKRVQHNVTGDNQKYTKTYYYDSNSKLVNVVDENPYSREEAVSNWFADKLKPDWTDGILGELGEKISFIKNIVDFVLFNDCFFAE